MAWASATWFLLMLLIVHFNDGWLHQRDSDGFLTYKSLNERRINIVGSINDWFGSHLRKHTNTHTYTHTYIHIHTHIYMHIYIYIHTMHTSYSCAHISIHIYHIPCTHIHTHHTHTHIHTHTQITYTMHIYIIHIYIYISMYLSIYIHMYKHGTIMDRKRIFKYFIF